MEKTNKENKKTQEFVQGLYDEGKHVFETEAQRHEASFQESLNEKFNEISNEARKQTDKILQDNANQSKVLSQISEEFGKQIEKIH
jgi:vacuolar-type H+-ATPase subunit H